MLLAPFYAVSELLVGRPLSVAIPAAEEVDLFSRMYDFFLFGRDHQAGVVPVGLISFDFKPSVGIYAFWNDAGFAGNDLSLHTEAWPDDWFAATGMVRIRLDTDRTFQVRVSELHRPDKVFFGIGPGSLESSESRYGVQRLEGDLAYEWRFWRSSRMETTAGLRNVGVFDGHYGSDGKRQLAARNDDALRGRHLDAGALAIVEPRLSTRRRTDGQNASGVFFPSIELALLSSKGRFRMILRRSKAFAWTLPQPPRLAFAASMFLGALVLSGSGCGAGGAGSAVRPKDPTFDGARGSGGPAVCHQVQAEGTPLIIDWDPEARGDLEVAMKQGVAVVHYDCENIKVLSDCRVEGTYGFLGITRQEQLISLDDADQVQANLPLSGAKLGASVGRGSSLDIGLIMVGKKTTTVDTIDRSVLKGRCEGATHFVHAATLGAFAMTTATSGELKAAVDVFGFGASAASSSKKSTTNRDGDVDSCKSSDPDAPKAPSGCGAPLRVQLLALGASGDKAAPKSNEQPSREIACGQGLVATNGKCAPAVATEAHDCDLSLADCTKQCDGGSAFSCGWASMIYSLGVDAPKDDAKAATFDHKGCEAGGAMSCLSEGLDLVKGEGVAKDTAKGVALMVRSCNAGAGQGCDSIGWLYAGQMKALGVDVPTDLAKAVRYYQRACDGGYANGCTHIGELLIDDKSGATVDKAKAAAMFQRACDANDGIGCDHLGMLLQKGDGVPAAPARAARLFDKACAGFSSDGCAHAGYTYETGLGVPADPTKAKAAYKQACSSVIPSKYACDRLKALGGS